MSGSEEDSDLGSDEEDLSGEDDGASFIYFYVLSFLLVALSSHFF